VLPRPSNTHSPQPAVAGADGSVEPSAHELRQFFDLSFDLLCTANAEGYFTIVNDAWERTLGYTREELLSRPFIEFVHPEDRERTAAEVARVREGGRAIDFENRYIGKCGEVYWFSWSATFSEADGLFYARATDTTERLTLQRRLDENTAALSTSNAELEQFVSAISHDLNTPMTAVAGFADLLRENYAESIGEPGRGWINRVVRGVERTQAFLDDLLAYTRTGHDEIAHEAVDMGALVNEIVASLQWSTDERGTEVRVRELPTISGDRSQLDRLLQNLLSNAVKFSDGRQPVVEVAAAREGDSWRFEIRDNGIGIPEDQRDLAFEPFERLPGGQEQPGTGIGLTICRRIVERHGGDIQVEDGIDGGAALVFTLPA
jgi:PAS domain S-box-containing protein